MKIKTLAIALGAVLLLSAAAYGFYWIGMTRGMQMVNQTASGASTAAAQKPGDVDPSTGKKVLYWHDPMVPGQRFDKPGKSPFMDMQLVPVYEGGGDSGGVVVDPRMQQSLGVRTAEVTKGAVAQVVEA